MGKFHGTVFMELNRAVLGEFFNGEVSLEFFELQGILSEVDSEGVTGELVVKCVQVCMGEGGNVMDGKHIQL